MRAPRSRRRRAAAMLAAALACGGMAAERVEHRARQVEARVGPLVPVVVARRDLPPGTRLGPADVPGALAVESVPERFAPPDALVSAADAAGQRLAAGVSAGGYLTAGHFEGRPAGDERAAAPIGRRQRAVEVAVTGVSGLEEAQPGSLVDVVVTEERRDGEGRSYVALQAVELLGTRPAEGDAGGEQAAADTLATLRVSLRQAVFLTAAHSFAREVRLLPRAPGDRERGEGVEVDAAGL